jgi:hypothetical protein
MAHCHGDTSGSRPMTSQYNHGTVKSIIMSFSMLFMAAGVLVVVITMAAVAMFIMKRSASAQPQTSIVILHHHSNYREMQSPVYTYNASLFPLSDNENVSLDNTFGIATEHTTTSGNRPKPPLSSISDMFSAGNNDSSSSSSTSSIFNFAFHSSAWNVLLGNDFGIHFPTKFGTNSIQATTTTSTTASSTTPTKSPTLRPSTIPTMIPTKTPSMVPITKQPSMRPTFRPSYTPTLSPIVPSPLYFFDKDTNFPIIEGPLSSFPKSYAQQGAFLSKFQDSGVSPQENFESYRGEIVVRSTFQTTKLTTIGTVTFNGDLRIFDSPFNSNGTKYLSIRLSSQFEILFSQLVAGVGFVMWGLGDEGTVPSSYNVQFMRNDTVVDTFTLNVTARRNGYDVAYIGYINYNGGFDKLAFPRYTDVTDLDQFNAFKASELK